MIKGTIKFFNKAKGFGFITPDDGSRDVFLPPVTVTATGAARLKTGQRVTFEAEPDVKGPKAVKLQLLDEPVKEIAAPAPAAKASLTLYYDGAAEEADDVVEALKATGQQARLIDYSATPLTHDQLKRLAMMLREVDQSLVRRYDHLFLELQLDDRFISENDFWTAIVEHPVLINGPVVVAGNRARICKTAADLRTFLGMDGEEAERKPKAISPRMLAMMTGQPVPALPEAVHKQPVHKVDAAPKPAAIRVEPKLPVVKVEPKPEPKAGPAKAEPKPAAVKAAPKAAAAKAAPKAKPPAAKKAEAPAKAKKKAPAKKAVKPVKKAKK
jgi:CspA family cold shock protein